MSDENKDVPGSGIDVLCNIFLRRRNIRDVWPFRNAVINLPKYTDKDPPICALSVQLTSGSCEVSFTIAEGQPFLMVAA